MATSHIPEMVHNKVFLRKEAKYGFGRLIDLARAVPVAILKHGRPVVAVMAIEEFERLQAENKAMKDQPEAPMRSTEET
jgi:prevent-host-death family protein